MPSRYFDSLDRYEKLMAAKAIRYYAVAQIEDLARDRDRASDCLGTELRVLEKLLRALESDE